jgi:ArsR family transcriptional regulator
MDDIDLALYLLQNRVRRQILERLVREPHYPMQLAEIIGVSQQAIMKHLKELEKGSFVKSEKVPSEKGGPPKTIFSVQKALSLRIDLGPDLFNCEHRKLPRGGPMRLSNRLPVASLAVVEMVSGRKKIAVGEGVGHLSHLNEILELHQHIRNRISAAVDSDFDKYEQRAMVHTIIEAPQQRLDLTRLSKELQLGQTQMNALLEEVQQRLERQISDRAGHIIATHNNSELRWWLPPKSNR